MRLRNDVRGYGPVSKVLHWLTAAAVAGQLAVGWIMEPDDAALDREKDRIDQLEEQGEEHAERQGEAAEGRFETEIDRLEDELNAREDNHVADAFSGVWSGDALNDGLSLPEVHVLLGLSIVVLGLLRVIWRAAAGLPPWADHLGAAACDGAGDVPCGDRPARRAGAQAHHCAPEPPLGPDAVRLFRSARSDLSHAIQPLGGCRHPDLGAGLVLRVASGNGG